MGSGSVSNWRWHRPTTGDSYADLKVKAAYWEAQAMQYKSERDQLQHTCERLSLRLGQTERMLTRVQTIFGFQIPTAPDNQETSPQPERE